MNTNEWITDRRPDDDDCIPGFYVVYNQLGHPVHIVEIEEGHPWKPIPKCEPYVKPKRYVVQGFDGLEGVVYEVYSMDHRTFVAGAIKTREAAERIAAIYEEVMP